MSHPKRKRSPSPVSASSAAAAVAVVIPKPKKLKFKTELVLTRGRKLDEAVCVLSEHSLIADDLIRVILEFYGYDESWSVNIFGLVHFRLTVKSHYQPFLHEDLSATMLLGYFSVLSGVDTLATHLDILDAALERAGKPEDFSKMICHLYNFQRKKMVDIFTGELFNEFFAEETVGHASRLVDALANVFRIETLLLSNGWRKAFTGVVDNPFYDKVVPYHYPLARDVVEKLGGAIIDHVIYDPDFEPEPRPNPATIDCFWVLFAFAMSISTEPIPGIEEISNQCLKIVRENPKKFENIPTVVPSFSNHTHFLGQRVIYPSSVAHLPAASAAAASGEMSDL